jgi:transposase InsO family protein
MALWNRQPEEGIIHHSDHGSQYTSLVFGQGLELLRPLLLGAHVRPAPW